MTQGPSVPVASWRIARDDELIFQLPTQTLWQRALAATAVGVGFLFILFVARNEADPLGYFMANVKALALVGVAEGLLFFLYRRLSSYIDVGSGVRAQKNQLPGETAVPVRVSMYQADSLTGTDEGFMWFEGGTLFFKGLQTVFRLNSGDVPPTERWRASDRQRQGRGSLPRRIPIELDDCALAISIRIVDSYEDFSIRKRSDNFVRDLDDWLESEPSSTLESLMPPTALHPNLMRTGPWKYEGVVAGMVLVFVNTAIFLAMPKGFHPESLQFLASNLGMVLTLGLQALAIRLILLEVRDLQTRRRLFIQEQLSGVL